MHRIYLSPHYDDICFSLGGFAEQSGGLLLNLFTRCKWTAFPVTPLPGQTLTDHVSALRQNEDCAFSTAARLEREDLPLPDSRVRGEDSFTLGDIEAVIADLANALIPRLQAMWEETADPRQHELYCPIGIGGHRDHVATLMAIRDAYPLLRKRCTVFFYEDLHYAAKSEARLEGLHKAHAILAPLQLTPRMVVLSPAQFLRKMSLIKGYHSQFLDPPPPEGFIPASAVAPVAHEIIWHAS